MQSSHSDFTFVEQTSFTLSVSLSPMEIRINHSPFLKKSSQRYSRMPQGQKVPTIHFKRKVDLYGFHIHKDGISPRAENIRIFELPELRNAKESKAAIGLFGLFRRHI
ncbi:hypothetical protein ACTFIR_009450 [Dictyostelium discoideum]